MYSKYFWLILVAICLCAWSMLGYLQYGLNLSACSMCILQRIPLLVITVLSFLMILVNKSRWQNYTANIISLATGINGVYLAYEHQLLQNPSLQEQSSVCLPAINVLAEQYGMFETLRMILNGDASCAVIQWQLFGLSIPELSLLLFISITILCMINLLFLVTGDLRQFQVTRHQK